MIFVERPQSSTPVTGRSSRSAVERHGVCVRAVGHDGQHDAIRLPGLFSEMLRDERIPPAELRQIRRHRDPDNPAAGASVAARLPGRGRRGPRRATRSRSSKQHQALKLHDTRTQAMGGMVEEWDVWRRTTTSLPNRR